MWLASALAKISNAAHQIPNEHAERSPATAHMFIINPLSGQGMDNLFATHPSTENRIAALRRLASEIGGGRLSQPRAMWESSRNNLAQPSVASKESKDGWSWLVR